MKKGIFVWFMFMVLAFGLASCRHGGEYMGKLQKIDSLMEDHPQAAYDSLCLYGKAVGHGSSQEVSMRYRLLMAKAQNKLYLTMPSDSSFQEVVDYYESKGTSNDKMAAHYLMGCIYRDQHESPRAIQCYQEAVECADTLSKDCDYNLLVGIYGQMADIFTQQGLRQEAYDANLKYSVTALKVNDINNYFVGKEQMAALSYSVGDTSKAESQLKACMTLYKKYGMEEKAAGTAPLLADIYLKRKQYGTAYRYMQLFEHKSGLYKNGDVSKGREYYYHVKGQYYLGINQLDSAKIFFQKLNAAGYHFEASKGLLAVYRKLKDWDHVDQYADLCERGMDGILKKNQTNAVLHASQMYDFHHIQRMMDKQILQKEQLYGKLLALTLVILVLTILGVYFIKLFRKKLSQQQVELSQSQEMLSLRKKEMELLNDRYLGISNELQQYRQKLLRMNSTEKTVIIDGNVIYEQFKKKGSGQNMRKFPTDASWKKLSNVMAEYFPLFYDMVTNKSGKKLSTMELRVAMLTRLHFSNSEMANVFDTSPASISNAKQGANEKMYGEKNAISLFQNMLGSAVLVSEE